LSMVAVSTPPIAGVVWSATAFGRRAQNARERIDRRCAQQEDHCRRGAEQSGKESDRDQDEECVENLHPAPSLRPELVRFKTGI
jgi:hypothetical protein